MAEIRYAQFCPLTRAVEILGERWTILIVRELLLGAKRFSDLKAALNGISPSVLADRLGSLEERGLVRRGELPPPAASAVYELTEGGLATRPLLIELTRWGMRFLDAPGPDDRIRPEWLLLGLQVFARATPTEDIGCRLRVRSDRESVDIHVRGGEQGTVVSREALPFDVTISGSPLAMLGFTNSRFAAGDDRVPDGIAIEGDLAIARRIPGLFDFQPASPPAATPVPTTAEGAFGAPAPQPVARSGRRQKNPDTGARR